MDDRQKPQTHASKDPFLLNYKPSELRIASEFFTDWLPFLSQDLCCNCTQSLSDRIRSIDPGSLSDSKNVNSNCYGANDVQDRKNSDNSEENCDTNSIGSWKDVVEVSSSVEPRMSWADMAQEDDEFGEEEYESNKNNVFVGESSSSMTKVVPGKTTLPREQREYIRFMNVRRKKDFSCFERIKGKLVNILEGLELHTSVFSAAEQKRIVNYIASLQEMGRKGELKDRTYTAPQKWMRGKGRQTIQFGCCYNYAVDRDGNPPGILQSTMVDPIPDLFKVIIRRLVRWHVLPPTCVPDSCIVNIYEEGDCIPPHIDNHDFVRPFCTISFLSECNILFGSSLRVVGPGEFDGSYAIPLPVGSVLVLNGNGADVAKHCVPAVPTRRISITFRRMDESKRPSWYVPEPDLQGIQPLVYEHDDNDNGDSTVHSEPRESHDRYSNHHMRRHRDSRGGWNEGTGYARRSDRYPERNEGTGYAGRSDKYQERNEGMGYERRSDRYQERNEGTGYARRSDRYLERNEGNGYARRSDRYPEPRESTRTSQRYQNRRDKI